MSKQAKRGAFFGFLPCRVTRYEDKGDKVTPSFSGDLVSLESQLFPLAAGAGGRAWLNPCICLMSITGGAEKGHAVLYAMGAGFPVVLLIIDSNA